MLTGRPRSIRRSESEQSLVWGQVIHRLASGSGEDLRWATLGVYCGHGGPSGRCWNQGRSCGTFVYQTSLAQSWRGLREIPRSMFRRPTVVRPFKLCHVSITAGAKDLCARSGTGRRLRHEGEVDPIQWFLGMLQQLP